jgi:hypothetical protein
MRTTTAILAAAALLSACGASDSSTSSGTAPGAPAAEAESLPSGGKVWEVDPASPPEAQMLAYLYGLHAFVLDGDEVFTATVRLGEVREDGSALVARLGEGLEARFEERDGKAVLAFSSGPVAMLRPHQDPGEKR